MRPERPLTNREFLAKLLNVPEQVERIHADCRRLFPPFPEHGETIFVWTVFRLSGFPFPGYPVPYVPNPLALVNLLQHKGWILWEEAPHLGDLYVEEGDEPGTVRDIGFVVGTGGVSRGYFLAANHRGTRAFRKRLEEVSYFLFV
jgi:hypothetical protein